MSSTESRLQELIENQRKNLISDEKDSLEFLTLSKIRKICENLQLKTTGRKKDLCSTLKKYFSSPEGLQTAYEKLSRDILAALFDDIDPISTYISNYSTISTNPSILCLPTEIEMLSQDKIATRCICMLGYKPYIKCRTCNTQQHWSCMGRNASMADYECPFCQIVSWDPLQVPINIFVMPYSLPREDPKFIRKKIVKTFEITEDVLRKVQQSPNTFEVQLRCLKFNGIGYNNIWPSEGGVILNDVTIMETHKILLRQELPLNISNMLKFGLNKIIVLKYNDTQYYTASVMLVKKMTFQEIYDKIHEDMEILSEDQGKIFAIKFFDKKNYKIPLRCLIKNRKIDEAVRGSKCSHIRCFDLISWLQLQGNPKAQRWVCPICKKRTTKVIKDKYIETILGLSYTLGDIEAIEFQPDGSYAFCSSSILKKVKNNTQVLKSSTDPIVID
jgi:MIZ/SP-RING zinc finger